MFLVFVNQIKHQFCSISEIVREERFSPGPPKSVYFLCKSSSLHFSKKYLKKNWRKFTHDYFLFKTLFSQVNNIFFLGERSPIKEQCFEAYDAALTLTAMESKSRSVNVDAVSNLEIVYVKLYVKSDFPFDREDSPTYKDVENYNILRHLPLKL